MPRHLNLRQIEAFKAVIENGTISRAADILAISQPAMSKLIAHLEFDTGLRLFHRVKGRLAPSDHGMRLYDEVGRIFAGVRQVESAVDAIRREEQGRLAIGVLPALAGPFIQRATVDFLRERDRVFCSVQSLISERVVDWLISRKLDVGLVSARVANPYVTLEPIMERPLVCVMAPDHELAALPSVTPASLDGTPFVAFDADIHISHLASDVLERHGSRPRTVLVANAAPTVCEFVAAGLGVSLVHPVMAAGFEGRLVARPFEPSISYGFQICRSADSRNAHIVEDFLAVMRTRSDEICEGFGVNP